MVSKLSYTYSIQIYIKIQISKQILQYQNNFIFDNWEIQDIYTYIKECVTNKYKNKTNELYIIFSFKHLYDLNDWFSAYFWFFLQSKSIVKWCLFISYLEGN